MQFQNRLATLSSVVNDSQSDLDAALSDLSIAVGEVQRFVAETRDKTAEQVQRLANVTQTLVDHRMDVENILHAAPTAFANGYNIYNPTLPAPSVASSSTTSPTRTNSSAARSAPSKTSPHPRRGSCARNTSARHCDSQLQLPTHSAQPDAAAHRAAGQIIYAEPNLAPGGERAGPDAPEAPPAVSAYTGLNESPPGTGRTC